MAHASGPSSVPPGSPAPRRGRVLRTVIQVLGELLVTAGVVLLLFVAWQLWWTNVQANDRHEQVVQGLADTFDGGSRGGPARSQAEPEGLLSDSGPPPVTEAAGPQEPFGIMYVPRFGEDYMRPLISGVGPQVLDKLGLGHYPETAMPGAVGNFAIAGHRQTHGKVLDEIHTLVPGDKLYVQTAAGYYTYVFRNKQIVLPHRSDVLLPVPTRPGAESQERIMTMTSCNPRFGDEERIIAYSVFESWRPLAAGPPPAIESQVEAAGK
ncbi:class E sortase [Arthrobacter castelli]|uniref:class E sortase n=1 Tax=Arthrobacter castelli TaxID=271431 RepID=UPI000479EE81|nr:class E sortase [Arthrobacter castelli]